MSSKHYDPRGRANHALLVGVYRYGHDDDLPGVKHNLGELAGVLLAGGVFGAEEIRMISPATKFGFISGLEEAAKRARGLLLLYFAGHGRLSHDGGELFLMVGESRRVEGDEPTYAEAVSWNRDVLPKLRDIAARGSVDRVVVILDCCNAGNALEEFKPGVLHRGRDRISVLTAVQVNRRIPSGNGKGPTPFTKQLVRLLREGVGGVAEEKGAVHFIPLAGALSEAMRGDHTILGDRWEPRSHRAETQQDVLLGLAAGPHPDPWWRLRSARLMVRARSAIRLRWPRPPHKSLVPLLTVGAVLAAAVGGYGVYQWVSGAAACAPPTELRLLTDPDAAPTIEKAVDAYLGSPTNQVAGGCRRSGISVDAPKATDAVTGFRRSAAWQSPWQSRSSSGFRPLRDVGAQPDIWIPGSTASYERVISGTGTGPSAAHLDSLGPLAFSPIVLAVPDKLSTFPSDRTGGQLADLSKKPEDTKGGKAVVLRADPEYTESAQLATVALYQQNKGQQPVGAPEVSRLERMAALLSPAPRSSYELMCGLAAASSSLEDRAAVVVPEQVMAQFNDAVNARDRLGCDLDKLSLRTPEYPKDAGMLNLPFIHVTWQGADRDGQDRDRAVTAFHDWLTGPDGQKTFTDAGYRGRTPQGKPAVPAEGSWLVDKGGMPDDPETDTVSSSAVATVLTRYRRALGPGRVLYLLDGSGSMANVWKGPGRAKDLLKQSLDSLGAKDEYAVWSLASPTAGHHDLVRFGTHAATAAATAAVSETLDAATTADHEADPGAALGDALAQLEARGKTDERPQLIVLITDDEDDDHLTGSGLTALLRTTAEAQIPVDWVSLASGGCTAGKTGRRIADHSGGRCLDTSGDQASELRDDVARVGTGDAQ